MATIRKEIFTRAGPDDVWAAMRDIGALHEKLVRGFVVDTKLEPGARIVTFANGLVARERIVAIDDGARRLVWAAEGGGLTHHNASSQVFAADGGGAKIVWIADILPDEVAPVIDGMMEHGARAMKATLDGAAGAPA